MTTVAMKTQSSSPIGRRGFTLIELLVVITIIAALAALAFSLGPKMLKKADATKSIQNMRQITPLMATYASENGSRLPPPRGEMQDEGGSWEQTHWFEAVLALIYPNDGLTEFKDEKWWEREKPFLRNPLCDEKTLPNKWASWNPGYAYNIQIISNLNKGSGDWAVGKNGPQAQSIPMAAIPDPAMTPLIAPRGDWHFTYTEDQIKEPGLKQFLMDEKMPVLFVDGHLEMIALKEYVKRELYDMPRQ